MKPIIEVNKLYKKYRIGEKQRYYSFRDSIVSTVSKMTRGLAPRSPGVKSGRSGEFWALKDVSFNVKPGEVLGIIGRNGAGKSTLLKILSRITPPTKGEITLRGRVASLLEVGTGFHPELTGRENIYLNGAILGMKRAEINHKFDEIVEFAEISKFLDTPVKFYSSGMYMRLAFAIAAHLDPEILLVDEVLAVGDAQFQKKCLGKMKEVSEQGRTILFVSHNMGAIEKLCGKVIILKEGKIEFIGETKEGIRTYSNTSLGLISEKRWGNLKSAPGDNTVRIKRVFSHKESGEISDTFDITKKIGITFEYEVIESGYYFTHGLNVYNEDGINVFNSHDTKGSKERNIGKYSSTAWIPENLLAEGTFSIGVAILKQKPFLLHAHGQNVLSLKVIDNMDGKSSRGQYIDGFPGVVRPLLKWESKKY